MHHGIVCKNENQPFPGKYLSYNNLNLNSMTNVKQYLTLKTRCRFLKVEDNSSNEGIIINTHPHTQSHLSADKMNILHTIIMTLYIIWQMNVAV